jgi:hypothetical protein
VIAALLSRWFRLAAGGARPLRIWLLEKSARSFMRLKQSDNAAMEFSVVPAVFARVVRSVACRQLQRRIEK